MRAGTNNRGHIRIGSSSTCISTEPTWEASSSPRALTLRIMPTSERRGDCRISPNTQPAPSTSTYHSKKGMTRRSNSGYTKSLEAHSYAAPGSIVDSTANRHREIQAWQERHDAGVGGNLFKHVQAFAKASRQCTDFPYWEPQHSSLSTPSASQIWYLDTLVV